MKKILLIITLFMCTCTMYILSSCNQTTDPIQPNECVVHMDDDNNGICDVCKKSLNDECMIHMDDDNDGICDVCKKNLTEDKEVMQGYYELTDMKVANVSYNNAYLRNYLYFTDTKVEHTTIDYSGKSTKEGTYVINNDIVTLKYGIYEYNYKYDREAKTIVFDGLISKRKTQMTYKYTDNFQLSNKAGKVNFTDTLFGESLDENFYNYCPSMMMEGNDTMHIWYCGNDETGKVTDYIMYRKGKLSDDGKWTFSEKEIALSPSNSKWDSRHCCDPSVIKGEFNYDGEKYNYLMSYLGCYTSDCTINMVGMAVAKSPSGPWEKVGDVPFCDYENSNDFGADGAKFWGYGQPSLVSVDKAGTIMLFYTKGIKLGTFTFMEKWDLSDLNNPKLLDSTKLADGGIIEVLNNADFAYDPVENRIYCIKEDHPYPSDGGVTWIPGSNSLYYVSASSTDKTNADCLLRNHSWARIGTINKSATSYARNHNCGILTDEYGWIINYEKIPVVYTSSNLATDYPSWPLHGQWPALHTYRLHGFIMGN